jgi:transposase-like protein
VAHARAKLTVLGRQLLVDRVLVDGWKPADAAKAMGVSRQSAYKWLRRFRDEGAAGLFDCTSAPRRCPHRFGADVVTEVVAARLETLHGPHRLAYRLGPIGWADPARPSTAYCAEKGLSRLSFIDRPTRTVVRYERDRPGELLHVDVKKLGRIREGGGWRIHGREIGKTRAMKDNPVGFDYLHVAVDDHSRVAFVRCLSD